MNCLPLSNYKNYQKGEWKEKYLISIDNFMSSGTQVTLPVCNDERPCFMRSKKKYPGHCLALTSTYPKGKLCPFCKENNEDPHYTYKEE